MTPAALTALIDATWPAAARFDRDGWTLREGRGGGSRVSAATAATPGDLPDIGAAEAAMSALGQVPLVMVREGEAALDAGLAARGFSVKDPVTLYLAPVAALTGERPPPVSCFEVPRRLAVQAGIWAAGGVGPSRLAVMDRVAGPATTILGRSQDQPAGTLFAALHDGTAMIHAVETLARFRRQGVGRRMVTASAFWARDHGARQVAILVTAANRPGNALYASLGMLAAAGYHYRIKDRPA